MESPHLGNVYSVRGKNGHGVEEWYSSKLTGGWNTMTAPINKESSHLKYISRGKLIPTKGIARIQGNKVYFVGREEPIEIDVIISAIGYESSKSHSYLQNINQENVWFDHIFNPRDPTIARVGFIRPVFGSIMPLAELQSIYIAKVISKELLLPRDEKLLRETYAQVKEHKRRYKKIHDGIPFFVFESEYRDIMLERIGEFPDFIKLFLESPLYFAKIIGAPITNFERFLGTEKQDWALSQIEMRMNLKKKLKASRNLSLIIPLLITAFFAFTVWMILFIMSKIF